MTFKEPTANVTSANQYSGYMPQLDTLRAFAVFLVLFSHWIPRDYYWFHILPYGIIGVILFFVLSGFLITQILLKSRIYFEEKKIDRIHSLKQFYIRRTLRIFPVYYFTLFVLYFFNIQDIRQKIFWFIFYASNFYFLKINSFDNLLSHLWTLSIEEQFYVFWPFVILFIPSKYLLKTIIAFIIIGPVFRFILLSTFSTQGPINFYMMLTPCSMDSFGFGALLAYHSVYKISDEVKIKAFKWFTFLYVSLVTTLIIFSYTNSFLLLVNFNLSLLSFFIIAKASIGFKGYLKKIFENKILVYLGKISYGLYLFHPFVGYFYKKLHFPPIQNIFLRFIIFSVILIAVSSVSWFILEKPINSLKKYFKYSS